MQAFGYTTETMSFMLIPLLHEKKDPIGSMGNDAALECLSDQPRMLYDYFKQLFAQVTNPAIDSIREEIIMSLECYIGPEGNLLETTEAPVPPPARATPDPDQRRAGDSAAARLPRVEDQDDRHHLSAERRDGRAWNRRSTESARRPRRPSSTRTA